MQIKRIGSVMLALALGACSVSKPSCAGSDIKCQYGWFMYEADRLPPNYTRIRELLLLDPRLTELPKLFEESPSGKAQTLAMSYLLVDLYRAHGRSICRVPQFHQMASTISDRIRWRWRTKSIERNLAKVDCRAIGV